MPVAVILSGKEEKEDGEEHAEERDEETPGKADILLHISHSHVGHQGSSIDKPVEPGYGRANRYAVAVTVQTPGNVLLSLFIIGPNLLMQTPANYLPSLSLSIINFALTY